MTKKRYGHIWPTGTLRAVIVGLTKCSICGEVATKDNINAPCPKRMEENDGEKKDGM